MRGKESDSLIGRILRTLHELTPRGTPIAAGHECLVHGDPGPYNRVMSDGLSATLIDWDSAHPGNAMEDVGYAGWTWCIQSAGHVPVVDQAERLRAFRDGYDPAVTPEDLLGAVVRAQQLIGDVESVNAEDPQLPEWRRDRARTAVAWASSDNRLLSAHREIFENALSR